jgi:hypothetical protein
VVEIESQWTARKRERLGNRAQNETQKSGRSRMLHPSPTAGEGVGHLDFEGRAVRSFTWHLCGES